MGGPRGCNPTATKVFLFIKQSDKTPIDSLKICRGFKLPYEKAYAFVFTFAFSKLKKL